MAKRKNKNKKKLKFYLFVILLIISSVVLIDSFTNQKIEYQGAGVGKIIGEDGYTTTFSSINNDIYHEYKQGGKASWANLPYWDNQMWDNGCGITTISIIASRYGKDITPEDLRKQYYPHLKGEDIPKAFQNLGINCTEFQYGLSYFTKQYVTDYLEKDKPIMVCVINKPTTKWTTSSHYLALLATDTSKEYIYVSNPNAEDGENDSSGWYITDDILPYIVKAVFIK